MFMLAVIPTVVFTVILLVDELDAYAIQLTAIAGCITVPRNSSPTRATPAGILIGSVSL